jgi:hypothetical protein
LVVDGDILNVVEAVLDQLKVGDEVGFDVVLNYFLNGDDGNALAVELEEVDGGGGLGGSDVGGLGAAEELREAEVWAEGEDAQSVEVIGKEVDRVAALAGLKNGSLFLVADLATGLGSGEYEVMLLAKVGGLCVQTLKPVKARDSVCDEALR